MILRDVCEMTLTIRPARPGEAALVLSFVRELADYEKLSHEVAATEAMIDEVLFGAQPHAFCEIAEWAGEPVGNALWFLNFSTFSGRPGIYLEDLFVRPAFRGRGIGTALMVHLANVASPRAGRASNGRCSTGMRPRSISTNRSARSSRTSGPSAA
jgi:GNAT superfamily N-acetyltransferase